MGVESKNWWVLRKIKEENQESLALKESLITKQLELQGLREREGLLWALGLGLCPANAATS